MSDRIADAPAGERLPASYLWASYLAHGVTTVGSAIAALALLLGPEIWPGRWVVAIFAVIFVLRVIDPLYTRATTRIEISPRELAVTTGLLARRTRSIRWSAVRTLESTAPWAHRVFGLVRVRIAQGGDAAAQLTLDGVTRELRDRILSLSPVAETVGDGAEAAEPEAPLEPAAPAVPVADGELLYRATAGDLVVASILFGRFAAVGLAAAFALYDLLDQVGLTGLLLGFGAAGGVGFAVVVGVAILAIGVGGSVVRYAGFSVRQLAGGGIRIEYGLIEKRERVIDASAITGVLLQRNALEMLLGRARLVLLTTDSSGGFGSNVLLPSLPRRSVARILEQGFSTRVPPVNLATRAGVPATAAFSFAVVIGIAAATAWGIAAAGAPLGLAIVAGLIAWALQPVLVRPLATRIGFDALREVVRIRSAFILEREIWIDVLAVHLMTETRIAGRTRHAAIHYYAGEPRQRGAVRFDESELACLRARLADRAARARRLAAARAEVHEREAAIAALMAGPVT